MVWVGRDPHLADHSKEEYREMGEKDLPPSKPGIPWCEPPQLTHLQDSEQGRHRGGSSQQHRDKASSPSAHEAGSKWINQDSIEIACTSSKELFFFLEHRKENFTRRQKDHVSRWPAAGGCHCQLSHCSGSLLLSPEYSIHRRTNEGGSGWHPFPQLPIPNFSSWAGQHTCCDTLLASANQVQWVIHLSTQSRQLLNLLLLLTVPLMLLYFQTSLRRWFSFFFLGHSHHVVRLLGCLQLSWARPGFSFFLLTAVREMLNAKQSPLRIPSLGPSDDGPEMCYL